MPRSARDVSTGHLASGLHLGHHRIVELERVAYDAALRSLDRQEQLVNELRSRTGIVIAASALAASFLGRPAVDEGSAPLFVASLAAFALSVGASLYVLLPRQNLFFTLRGSGIYEALYEWRDDVAEVHRRLTYELDRLWAANDARLQRVFRAFRIAAWALAAEVVLLLASVGATLT
jgi:hypothetical protein